jgi:hypothetical protein
VVYDFCLLLSVALSLLHFIFADELTDCVNSSSILGAMLSNMFLKADALASEGKDSSSRSKDPKQETRKVEGFYEELPIAKFAVIENSVTVSVIKCLKTAKNLLYLVTDLPGEVVVHWGVCRDDAKKWEIPAAPHPPETTVFKNKALRTVLQV